MYDRKLHKWISDCDDELLLKWSNEAVNADRPEAQFIQASCLLADIQKNDRVAEAVALMESAAKKDYPQAIFALGQMFEWGWAVHKDKNKALELYQRAAELKYKPAQDALNDRKKRKFYQICSVCAAVVICIALGLAAWYSIKYMDGKVHITVHPDTELSETATVQEFAKELQALLAEYDDELVISGQVSTNRIVLKFEGNHLDLSDFMADYVISRENNKIIIQFDNEEEAQRCLEELKNKKGIVFAVMDEYENSLDSVLPPDSKLPIIDSCNPQENYFSWGVADMGLDQLVKYMVEEGFKEEILVAVIDAGVAVPNFASDRYLEPFNVVTGGAAVKDYHGTHVAGTILDGTLGTNTYILGLDVFNGEELANYLVTALAVELAKESGASVINMSMGGQHSEASQIVEDAIQDAIDAGVSVVVSAGNETMDTVNRSYAAMEDCIVVASYDINHKASDFSNFGSSVDVAAPGENIYSINWENTDTLIPMNGTSMSAPHVSAMVALLRGIYTDASPAEIEKMLKESCRTYRNPGMYEKGIYGVGAPDATAFIETMR